MSISNLQAESITPNLYYDSYIDAIKILPSEYYATARHKSYHVAIHQ